MPFSFTDDQQALVSMVRDVLADRCTSEYVRAATADGEGWRGLWDELTALDLPALSVPEADGGLELGPVEIAGICEAAGRAAAPVPLTATVAMFVPLLAAAAGDDEAAHALLRRVATEGLAGTACLAGGARLDGDRLTLTSGLVGEAGRAEWVAAPALRGDGTRALVLAPARELGLKPVDTMDRTRPLGRIAVTDHRIADGFVVQGDPDAGIAVALTGIAAELVGLAAELVARSVAYAAERVQFGSPIGSFQAVKHQLVDAHVAVERARSLTYRAAVVVADAAPEARRVAHVAKAAAGEAATAAARTAVQVHGGIGITREHDVSLLYLRARQDASWLGGPDDHYAAAASLA